MNTSFPPAEFDENPERPISIGTATEQLLGGGTLSYELTCQVFESMMTGRVDHAEIGALLGILATRVPTGDEIAGAAAIMRKHVRLVDTSVDRNSLLDTAGTGGAPKTFNVSTAAAIVAAAGGANVAKHGNKSRTGRGSAELLQGLGVNIQAPLEVQTRCLDEFGVCFCFAPNHHPATKHVMPVRKALGFPTIFNLLGPLTNPVQAGRQLMGVYAEEFLAPVAEAFQELGTVHSIVMHSEDGLDEISISAATRGYEIYGNEIQPFYCEPEQFGFERVDRMFVTAKSLPESIQMVQNVLNGKDVGPVRNMVLMSSGVSLHLCGIADSLEDGVKHAKDLVVGGRAQEILEKLVAYTSVE